MKPSWHRFPAGIRGSSGFTLLEVLMAVVIFAVIATMVYGAMNASISRVSAIKDGDRVFEMGAGCLHRISMDLRSVYADSYPLFTPPDNDDSGDPYAFVGETDYSGGDSFSTLRFAAFAHLPLSTGNPENRQPASSLARIRYWVQRAGDSDEGYVLKRSDRQFVYDRDGETDDAGEAPVVCTQITEFELTYFDHEGNGHETWDSSDDSLKYATPRAVAVFFRVETEQGNYPFFTRVVVPVSREPLERVEN